MAQNEGGLMPQKQSSNLPSITELISLRQRENYYNRQSVQSQANKNVDRVLSRFKSYEGLPIQKAYAQTASLNPAVQQAFQTAGVDMDVALQAIQMSPAQKTERARETAVLGAEAERAVTESPAGIFNEAVRMKRMDKELRLRSEITSEAKQRATYGYYRNEETGDMVPTNMFDAKEGDLAFVPKDLGEKEIERKHDFQSTYDVILPIYKVEPAEFLSDLQNAFSNQSKLGRSGTSVDIMNSMFNDYQRYGSAKERDMKETERQAFRAALAGQEFQGHSPRQIQEMLGSTNLMRGGPSPYAFALNYIEALKPNQKERKSILQKFLGGDSMEKKPSSKTIEP